ncbi:flagellar hook capping FlgD N-terminal domain-containing protein [Acidaminobacter hydrogenoformans]|uniref:Flagellar basal-body rod modification protein FlgD n=1 Tax=Acidaminobacter hydrogenoformans DSM 2784 TaxID=1120920 RepID=A0A1G5RWG7_9FIRM|nr:flagellar hook capping FlgD N-terminal domain-containing protein [Acidaminobacter hydrogenoformans]SCZ77791.1 flagellar basal-body rod modification protein FlgD [Acidaminobacter hydrogenoformans DSM 2784]
MEISNFNIFKNAAGTSAQLKSQGITESNSFVGKNDFFNILAAQLKYQDPMAGGDNSEYIAQMSQFAMIEKLENLSDQINALYNLNSAQNALEVIGKEVVLDTMEAGEVRGIVDRVEISSKGINYVVDGQTYMYPALLSVGSGEAQSK